MNTRAQGQAKPLPKPSFTPARTNLIQRKCACGGTPGPDGECAACRAKRLQWQSAAQPMQDQAAAVGDAARSDHHFGEVRIKPEARSPATPASISSPQDVTEAAPTTQPPIDLSSAFSSIIQREAAGQSLTQESRESMERLFGHDFSTVRLHQDSRAVQVARLVHANAFAVGEHIFWGMPEVSPTSLQGRQLLGHELVHVLQQRQMSARSSSMLNIELADSGASEREAERIAADVVRATPAALAHEASPKTERNPSRGSPVSVRPVPQTAQLQRKPGQSFTACVDDCLASAGIANTITTLIWVTCGVIGGIGALGGTLVEPGGGTLTGLGLALAGCLALGTGFPIGVIIGCLKDCAD